MHRTLLIVLLFAACGDCKSNNDIPDAGDMAGEVDVATGADSGLPDGFSQPFDPARLGWGLHVIGRSATDIYVAGGAPGRGGLLHFDGTSWVTETIPGGTPLLNWVLPFDDGQAAAVGLGGTILWNDGEGWARQSSSTTETLWGVWGTDPTDVWAVGGSGRAGGEATVLHFDGTEWTEAELPVLQRTGVNAWFKVWGTDTNNVYVVGQKGGVLHWDGVVFEAIDVGTEEDLISVWGTGPDDILLVGGRSNGVLSHYDGVDWFTESIAPAPGVNGVWMPARGEFWLAGVRGMLRRGTVVAEAGGRSFDVPRARPLATHDLHAVFGVDGYGLITVGGNFVAQDGPYTGLAFVMEEGWQ